MAMLAFCNASADQTAKAAVHQTVVDQSIRVTPSTWQYTLPVGDVAVLSTKDRVVVGGSRDLIALDARSGKPRWRNSDGIGVGVASGKRLFLSSGQDEIQARSASDGKLSWRTTGVCPREHGSGGPGSITLFGDSLIVGCAFGMVARIDARTGAVLAKIDTGLDYFSTIERLGACAYGISGETYGSVGRSYSLIVRCDTLATILPRQEALSILGTIGNHVVLDGGDCEDSNCPDNISVVDLGTGKRAASERITESNPAASGMLVDGHLYLFFGRDGAARVDGTVQLLKMFDVYDYGNPREPLLHPRKVIDNLLDGYQTFDASVAGAQASGDSKSMRARIFSLFSLDADKPTTVWSTAKPTDIETVRLLSAGLTGLDTTVEPTAVAFTPYHGSEALVRLRDYKELIVDRPCASSPSNATDEYVIFRCPTKKLVNHQYIEYLAAYRW
jgi:hypothetical protein